MHTTVHYTRNVPDYTHCILLSNKPNLLYQARLSHSCLSCATHERSINLGIFIYILHFANKEKRILNHSPIGMIFNVVLYGLAGLLVLGSPALDEATGGASRKPAKEGPGHEATEGDKWAAQ